MLFSCCHKNITLVNHLHVSFAFFANHIAESDDTSIISLILTDITNTDITNTDIINTKTTLTIPYLRINAFPKNYISDIEETT